jgi:hypothetical protein
MHNDIELFEVLNKSDFFIVKWLRKPQRHKMNRINENVAQYNEKIFIGMYGKTADKIVEKMSKFDDINKVASEMELPVALIHIVLKKRGACK